MSGPGGGKGLPWAARPDDWFLALWLGLEVAGFFAELAAHVERLPATAEGTAEMPLAAQMLLWPPAGRP